MPSALATGFADGARESQAVFRVLLAALSRPGIPCRLPAALAPPEPLTPELGAIALALADADAPLWLDGALRAVPAVADFLRFHTGAPIVAEPYRAAFALVRDPEEMPDLAGFALGSPEYPDSSTTVVIAVEGFGSGEAIALRGPGIRDSAAFTAAPLRLEFARALAGNAALFPRGVDVLLAAPGQVIGIPRSSSVALAWSQAA